MEKLEMKWSLKNSGYLKSKKGGCGGWGAAGSVCTYGYVCVEMKKWKKSIPEK